MALLASSAYGKPCPPMSLQPKILTPDRGTLAAKGGGIVVAAQPVYTRHADHKPDLQPTWRVRAGSQTIAPGVRPIAPGLSVYDVGEARGELVLEDMDQKALLRVTRRKLAPLAAPKPKRVWSTESVRTTRRPYAMVSVELEGKAPATAVALVVFGADGAARSWGAVTGDVSTTAVVYSTGGGCGAIAPGTLSTHAGERVRLAWLDGAGRLSKLSAPIRVVRR